jgi:hypothetical protein
VAVAKVDICNLALSQLGVRKVINSFDERTNEAASCRLWYDIALDELLRDFPWPFATKVATLAPLAFDGNSEWAFKYEYPSDCSMAHRIVPVFGAVAHPFNPMLSPLQITEAPLIPQQRRIPFRVYGDALYTNVEEAQLEYTNRNIATSAYKPDFIVALANRLAVYIAPMVSGGDEFKLGPRSFELYKAAYMKGRANAANEGAEGDQPDASWIAARGW